jgi:YD repeat-containing protein
VTSETNTNGKTSRYAYDALGQLIQYTDSLGNTTKADYDARGNLIKLTDARGNAYQFEYDGNDRLTKEILPLGQETQYQYDANGNLIRKTTPNGHQTEYGYDVMNRLVEIRHTKADGTLARTGTYTWDANHNLTGWSEMDHIRNESSSASLAYDDQNRKTQESLTYADGHSQSYRYGYSLAGKKTKLVWPDGTEIGYGYSNHGELNRVTIPGEGTIQINEYGWTLPKKTTLPGGITQARGYDGLLNLEGLEVKTPEQQTPLQLTNAYGKEQELKERSRTDTANSTSKSKTETFTYDDELRLTEVETEGILFNDREEFTLDAVGNRTQHSEARWCRHGIYVILLRY